MLATLPTAYPDETVHSLCSRLLHRLGLPPGASSIDILFGEHPPGSFVDLPQNLDKLLANILHSPHITIEALILDHTLAPFYAVWWTTERVERMLQQMGWIDFGYDPMRLFVRGAPERVQYCPLCAEEQRRQFDEAWWVRVHQAVAVTVCPVHHVFLEQSTIRSKAGVESAESGSLPRGFYFPDLFATRRRIRPIDPNNPTHQLMLAYAEDAAWLLQQRFSTGQRESLMRRIELLLAKMEYGYDPGSPERASATHVYQQLQYEIQEFYPDEFLHRFSVSPWLYDNWIPYVLPNPHRQTLDPLRHWLLIRFFGYSMAEFFALPEVSECPWFAPKPCLNMACPNHGEKGAYQHPCAYTAS